MGKIFSLSSRRVQMESGYKTIEEVCSLIDKNRLSEAKRVLKMECPFVPLSNAGRHYSEYQKTKIFLRDGFIDRYSGGKMVFPPVLRLLSSLMPDEFPFHKNWKMSECHLAYWQLLPTVDHIIPVSRGGVDDESNWVCTSQLRNSVKSNWSLEELGWTLHKAGTLDAWDGLVKWFMGYVSENPDTLRDSYIHSWYIAAKRTVEI
jgi:hypothetical protein